MSESRSIRPLPWVAASEVLPHEEHDFTVWLADNLGLLAEALGLESISLLERESRVESYRADILAIADDGSDEGLPVIIENQYGRTDHRHLGQLVTYLAAQQRGLGVWVVEEATEPHRAAVDFLNRTSDDSVGYALVVVRFAPAPTEGHYVDFDVISEPNLWTKPASSPAGRSRGTPERREFLETVAEQAGPQLMAAGWERVKAITKQSPRIRLGLPRQHPLAAVGGTFLRASATELTFRCRIEVKPFERSCQIIEAMKSRYEQPLNQELPDEAELRWHTGHATAREYDQALIVHRDGGYASLQPDQAVDWVVEICTTWLRLTKDFPPELLETPGG